VFVYGTLPTTLMRVVSTAVYGTDARPLDIRNVGRTLACIAEIVAILMVYLLACGLTVRPLAAVAALLYALAPLPIQLSHFATVDAMASPWVLAALALAVRLPRLRWPGWVALALCIAVAAAMRITLLSLWVLVPLHWLVVRQLPTRRQFGLVLLAGCVSIVGLWVCDPTIWNGWWFDARWLHDVLLAGRLVNGMVDTPPTYQWSWQTPFVYPLAQMGWWGMGPLLFLAATVGWLWQSLQPRRRVWLLWLWSLSKK
jgi:4-amino-4-deoxy-L-arabinose transferase-like glycosyltransferase